MRNQIHAQMKARRRSNLHAMLTARNLAGALCVVSLCFFLQRFAPTSTPSSSRDSLSITTDGASKPPSNPIRAKPVDTRDDLIDVYLGAGCFWHVQHELVRFEQAELSRPPAALTAVVGYAGGNDREKQPCYHNLWRVNDYNDLGHTEVVLVRVPPAKLTALLRYYFTQLLVNGDRVDVQDRGAEYRSVVGVPGGIHGAYAEHLEAAGHPGVDLAEGRGGDPDTLYQRKVYVMDTTRFPFFQGEIYHQFHDDMVEKYSSSYHQLKRLFVDSGRLKPVPPCSDDSS